MTTHEGSPLRDYDPVPPEARAQASAQAKAILHSRYHRYVEKLRPLVAGKTVAATEAGHSGYMLRFDDGSWVLCYLRHKRIEWKTGRREPSRRLRARMSSRRYGDGGPPLSYDYPYAGEYCDLSAEIGRSRGATVDRFAIGADTFNFTFPEGRELDTAIVTVAGGKQALRVFWEQW